MKVQHKPSSDLIRIIIISCIGWFQFTHADGQQEPQFTQYMFNTTAINPAYAGTRDAINLLWLSRIQWTGMEGAPRTNTFSVHAPIQNYRMGLGLSVVTDAIGPVKNHYISMNYAYRVQLTEQIILSMGLKGGIYNYNANLRGRHVGGGVDSDPAFSSNQEVRFRPNAGIGMYMYTNRWYLGLSAPKLLETHLTEINSPTSVWDELKRHYFFIAGYVFDVNRELKLKPSMMAKYVEGAPLSVDIAAQFVYQEQYWIGCSYRFNDAFALIANWQLSRQLMLGYSYDRTISDLGSVNDGTHEILISFDFDGMLKKKLKSPRFF